MSTNLILFDFDGTLADTRAKTKELMVAYFEKEKGLVPDLEIFFRNYHRANDLDFGWGMAIEDQYSFVEKMFVVINQQIVDNPSHAFSFYDGMEELLHNLHDKGFKLGIVTSRHEPPVFKTLEKYKISKLFSSIRTYDDIERRGHRHKPAPDKLLCVMEELSIAANDVVMVGDTSMDIEAGLAAKTGTLGVSWGYHERHLLEEAGAHVIVDEGRETYPAIASLLNRK